jgi:hypothetical protein
MKVRILSIALLMCVLCGPSSADESRAKQLKQSVVFLFYKNGTNDVEALGTGFWVGLPDSRDTNLFFPVLVTAKHVLWNGSGIHCNFTNGIFRHIELDQSVQKRILLHPDPTVDIVALVIAPKSAGIDYRIIPYHLITSREDYTQLQIEEGENVFFVGLFSPFYVNKRNYPIFRFGRVAMVTDERVGWGNDTADLYLMETQSYPGNSGSPVFFDIGPLRQGKRLTIGGNQTRLAGIMRGTWTQSGRSRIQEVSGKSPQTEEQKHLYSSYTNNLGIAAVTPAYYLREILSSPEAKKMLPLAIFP